MDGWKDLGSASDFAIGLLCDLKPVTLPSITLFVK